MIFATILLSMILYFWVSLRMMIQGNFIKEILCIHCWTELKRIMIFMKCSWVPYNLCLSTAILKGVNIFCILWLATKHHQSKLDLYQPQTLKRVSRSLSLLLLLSNDHPLQKPLIVDRKRSRAWHKHLKEPRTTHFSKNLQSVSLCTDILTTTYALAAQEGMLNVGLIDHLPKIISWLQMQNSKMRLKVTVYRLSKLYFRNIFSWSKMCTHSL